MLLHGFVKVFTWIFSRYFSHFSNKAEVWPTFQSLLKLLLWTKGVEWVKILYVLGPLCLWQCFFTLPVNRLTNIVSEHQPTISGNLMIGHGYNRDLTNKCTLKCLYYTGFHWDNPPADPRPRRREGHGRQTEEDHSSLRGSLRPLWSLRLRPNWNILKKLSKFLLTLCSKKNIWLPSCQNTKWNDVLTT